MDRKHRPRGNLTATDHGRDREVAVTEDHCAGQQEGKAGVAAFAKASVQKSGCAPRTKNEEGEGPSRARDAGASWPANKPPAAARHFERAPALRACSCPRTETAARRANLVGYQHINKAPSARDFSGHKRMH